MRTHHSKLERANVVAEFDTQEEAEDAVYELRLVGFRDDQIGFLTRNVWGQVLDFAGRHYTVIGAIVGVILGAALGGWAGTKVLDGTATPLGPAFGTGEQAVLLTNAISGALLAGIAGALLGWGIPTREAVHPGSEVEMGQFVVAVDARDRKDQACAVLRHHGGYEPTPAPEPATPPPSGLPAY